MPANKNRSWCIASVEDAATLADKLTNYSWTLCTGFRLGGYLFLNDSFSEDGAGEWAVVREADLVQVESITFSWCDAVKALDYVNRAIAGEFKTEYATVERRRLQEATHDGTTHCRLCA